MMRNKYRNEKKHLLMPATCFFSGGKVQHQQQHQMQGPRGAGRVKRKAYIPLILLLWQGQTVGKGGKVKGGKVEKKLGLSQISQFCTIVTNLLLHCKLFLLHYKLFLISLQKKSYF